ncbi:MAG: 23S rRNA (pseudouridine(1915)-N(3))-methyltransferase RlmH [Candidatus Nanoarchaeia archaeon]
MNKIRIIAVGKIKEAYLRGGLEEFLKRLKPYIDLEIIEIKDEGKEKESKKFLDLLGNNTFILDAEGKAFSSEEFSSFLKTNRDEKITLIIGGHDGFSDELKKKAQKISLSKMTFTHEMTRLILVEQIYRSCMIQANKPYHK